MDNASSQEKQRLRSVPNKGTMYWIFKFKTFKPFDKDYMIDYGFF